MVAMALCICIYFCCFLTSQSLVRADIIEVSNMVIYPSPIGLHYSTAALKGPNALINLKEIIFHTIDFLPGHQIDEGGASMGYTDDNNAASETPPPISAPSPTSSPGTTSSGSNNNGNNGDAADLAGSAGSDEGINNVTDTLADINAGNERFNGSETGSTNNSTGVVDGLSDGSTSNGTSGTSDAGFGGGQRTRRFLDGGVDMISRASNTQVDVIVSKLPDDCGVYTPKGCDLTTVGVGVKVPTEMQSTRWCCTDELKDMGLCAADNSNGSSQQQVGRIILTDAYQGYHRWVDVPAKGSMTKTLKQAEFIVQDSGTWIVAFANCNAHGRPVVLSGSAVFENEYGYLPAELLPFMYFSTVVMIVYATLFVWYLCRMRTYASASIPIEKWILGTISIGLLEMIFRTAGFYLWNSSGYQHIGNVAMGILLGIVKDDISRCLVLMVSLGWGVTADILRCPTLIGIIILGLAYFAVSAAIDILLIEAVEDMNTMSFWDEREILDYIRMLKIVLAVISSVFSVWIFLALLATILQLRRTNQSRKLMRYLSLTFILVVFITLSTLVSHHASVLGQDIQRERIVVAVSDAIYLVLLIGVAYLWRPNESAREYAYAMELSTVAMEGNDLELTVVPSCFDHRGDEDNNEPMS